MRKPHIAWWADKRNKGLATNIEAMRYILDGKDVPYELGCRLKDEANYQESLNLLKQEQIRNHGNK